MLPTLICKQTAFAAFVSAICICSYAAQAASVTKTYSFTINNFVNAVGSDPSPKTSIYGRFTVDVDPTGRYKDNSAVVTLDSLTAIERDNGEKIELAPGSIVRLTQFPIDGHVDTFIDGVPIGNWIEPGTNNLVLGFDLSTPRFLNCGTDFGCGPEGAITGAYTLATLPQDVYVATSATVSAVPLPASLPSMAGALLALSAFGLGQRRLSASKVIGEISVRHRVSDVELVVTAV